MSSAKAIAQQEPDDAVIQMVLELLDDPDRDMRALAFQQIREEVPGETATKKFAEMLPKLPPDGQAGLLEALGDRGDVTARPAVLEMLTSPEETVRAAALRALGTLGNDSDVALLAKSAAAGSKAESTAARQSLVRLRGSQTNAAILSTLADSPANVRVGLLGVLAARNAKETLPTVLESTKDADAGVRLAALDALRFLADAGQTAAIVNTLTAAKDDPQRRHAELALLAVCSRGGQACAEAIIAALADANTDVPSRLALLQALGRSGGQKALAEVVARLDDKDEAVRDQAMRMLSIWPDAAAAEHLLKIAKTAPSLRHQVLAIRGLVRLASPRDDKAADLKTLGELMQLAKRPQEKRLVLGVLGGTSSAESLRLVTPALDDPALVEEAALAAVMIAERMQQDDKDLVRTAMDQVLKRAQNQKTCQRARKVLQGLGG